MGLQLKTNYIPKTMLFTKYDVNVGYQPGHKGYYDTPLLDFWANAFKHKANDLIPPVKLMCFIGEYMKVTLLHLYKAKYISMLNLVYKHFISYIGIYYYSYHCIQYGKN